MFDIIEGDLVKVVGSSYFMEKPYYRIMKNMNIVHNMLTSHPYKVVDDLGSDRWLKRGDIIKISEVRCEIIDYILDARD